MDYVELKVTISPYNEELADILIAELADAEYESFDSFDGGFNAYIKENLFSAEQLSGLNDMAVGFESSLSLQHNKIVSQNWNALWESNFDPIVVDDECILLAHFHKVDKEYKYKIVMEPKMAFGTGHHETTFLMASALLKHDCSDSVVLDMGAGTGVLGILAAMRGAKEVDLIDIDEWSYNSSLENAAFNGVSHVTNVFCGDAALLTNPEKYDLILANINRNILINDMPTYYKSMKAGASIFFSGILLEDIPAIEVSASALKLKKVSENRRNKWAFLQFVK
jgi:ribosomal protein L11 methyltransferase